MSRYRRLVIEFQHGDIQLTQGQMHRTHPLARRSVNLTFEAADTEAEPKLI